MENYKKIYKIEQEISDKDEKEKILQEECNRSFMASALSGLATAITITSYFVIKSYGKDDVSEIIGRIITGIAGISTGRLFLKNIKEYCTVLLEKVGITKRIDELEDLKFHIKMEEIYLDELKNSKSEEILYPNFTELIDSETDYNFDEDELGKAYSRKMIS